MSNSGKAGSGRGNNRRRSFKRRDGDNNWQQKDTSVKPGAQPSGQPTDQKPESHSRRGGPHRKHGDRPKWNPQRMNPEALPAFDCPYCGKPIRDVASAIADKDTGVPIHFDCVTSRIGFGEKLEKGEAVVYIGGGRFGVVSFVNTKDSHGKPDNRDFKIKKVIEWENKEKRADWRSVICEHYSDT